MSFISPDTPNIPDYTTWIFNIMGVSPINLPSNSIYITYTFNLSMEIVNQTIESVSPIMYTIAVYNLGGDFLINNVQDMPGGTYWTNLRSSFQLNSFVPGLINATNDEDTSAAIITPLSLQNITLADLQNLKTPYGRIYLGIAQSQGTMWGLS